MQKYKWGMQNIKSTIAKHILMILLKTSFWSSDNILQCFANCNRLSKWKQLTFLSMFQTVKLYSGSARNWDFNQRYPSHVARYLPVGWRLGWSWYAPADPSCWLLRVRSAWRGVASASRTGYTWPSAYASTADQADRRKTSTNLKHA